MGWATLDKFFILKKCVLKQWNSPRTKKFLVKPGVQDKTSWLTKNFTIYERSFGYGFPGFGRKILLSFVPY